MTYQWNNVVVSGKALWIRILILPFLENCPTVQPMNTDEPTKDLTDPAEYETKPVLELILERVNTIGDEVMAVRIELTAFRAEFQQFKEDTERNFDRVYNSLEIMNNDVLKIRTDILGHEKRIKDQERKAS